MSFIDQCRHLVSLDSTPVMGNCVVADWCAQQARDRGFFVEEQLEFFAGVEQKNLIIRPQQSRPDVEFLLQNHLDTVDPGPYQLWRDNFQNPFAATIKDGKIFGLGVIDGKVDFLCKLEAMSAFVGRSFSKMPPVLVATYGAHQGMVGALKLIRKNKISAKMALIGEASSMKLIKASPGYATVEIKVPFNSGEVSYKQEHNLRESTSTQSKLFSSENAIRKMFDYLLQLPENLVLLEIDGGSNPNTLASNAFLELDLAHVEFPIANKLAGIYQVIRDIEQEFQTFKDPIFGSPTINFGMVRTWDDHVQIQGTCRIPPVIEQNIYEGWMERINKKCLSMDSTFKISDYKKPYRMNEGSILGKGCQDIIDELGLDQNSNPLIETNESSLFSRVGIDCICIGPGERKNSLHTFEENVSLEEAQKAIQFYTLVLERFCL